MDKYKVIATMVSKGTIISEVESTSETRAIAAVAARIKDDDWKLLREVKMDSKIVN